MLEHLLAIFSGAVFVIAVIAGIGPQNLNIISHAIKRNFAYSVTTTCFIADSILILAGGIGLSITNSPTVVLLINLIGIVFLSFYILQKGYSLFQPRDKFRFGNDIISRKSAMLKALVLTWLNPLVFIDTIVVIGGTASQYDGMHKVNFLVGAVLGDFCWLFGLTYVMQLFSHRLNRSIVWICLDLMTISIMGYILYRTIYFVIQR